MKKCPATNCSADWHQAEQEDRGRAASPECGGGHEPNFEIASAPRQDPTVMAEIPLAEKE